jgi:hypothetical protein
VNIGMDDEENSTLEAIGRFVAGNEDARVEAEGRQQPDVFSGCPLVSQLTVTAI